jgi:hypothetical protein
MPSSLDLLAFVVRGMALGIAFAAPIGPIGLLCMQRTLTGGVIPGLATGHGAATTHSVYASIAATGLSALGEEWLDLNTPDLAPHSRAFLIGDPVYRKNMLGSVD